VDHNQGDKISREIKHPRSITALPVQNWTGPESSGGWAPRFADNRHMKVVRFSPLRSGHLYLPENIPGTHFY